MVSPLHPADIFAWADRLGIQLWVVEDRIRYAPPAAAPQEFVAALGAAKAAMVEMLTAPEASPAQIADSLDACIRLGQRLSAREISGLLCGLTGRACYGCAGIPCLGSTPLGVQRRDYRESA